MRVRAVGGITPMLEGSFSVSTKPRRPVAAPLPSSPALGSSAAETLPTSDDMEPRIAGSLAATLQVAAAALTSEAACRCFCCACAADAPAPAEPPAPPPPPPFPESSAWALVPSSWAERLGFPSLPEAELAAASSSSSDMVGADTSITAAASSGTSALAPKASVHVQPTRRLPCGSTTLRSTGCSLAGARLARMLPSSEVAGSLQKTKDSG